jgi:hypothetical protein
MFYVWKNFYWIGESVKFFELIISFLIPDT